jgi:hypothetical protein
MKKYMIRIVGEGIPYITEVFNTKEEAKNYIKVLENEDRVLGCVNEYYVKEVEV